MSRLRQIAEYDPSVQKDKVHPQKDENLTYFGQTTAELDRFNLAAVVETCTVRNCK